MKLAPGQTLNVELPVKTASDFGMTFIAASRVSASVSDDHGAIVGENLKDTPAAGQLFRSIYAKRAVAAGTWTLMLRNDEPAEQEVVLSTWSKPG